MNSSSNGRLGTLVASAALGCAVLGAYAPQGRADEDVFGYVKSAEPLPKGAVEVTQWFTQRSDKGIGHYSALDSKTELEYGFTDKFSGEIALLAQSIDTSGIMIDGYIPGDKDYGLRVSGIEGSLKYNFLSAAKDPIGLSVYMAMEFSQLDPHSGQDKDIWHNEVKLLLQKFFLDDQLIVAANAGIESTIAKRKPIDNLPADFEWPTGEEMEIEFIGALGVSYRFAPNWFVGLEAYYEEEHETEIGQERWSIQAGPNVHYASKQWWATFTWLPQIRGGGSPYPGQTDENLHLIEKTKQELRLKVGYNF
jgi:hypothetical protein